MFSNIVFVTKVTLHSRKSKSLLFILANLSSILCIILLLRLQGSRKRTNILLQGVIRVIIKWGHGYTIVGRLLKHARLENESLDFVPSADSSPRTAFLPCSVKCDVWPSGPHINILPRKHFHTGTVSNRVAPSQVTWHYTANYCTCQNNYTWVASTALLRVQFFFN